MQKKIIVIPTYNEKENVKKVTEVIVEQQLDFDILFVDDNSPDGTENSILELQKEYPNVKYLKRLVKDGLGRAYIAGFRWALDHGYDLIMQMDCDLSHDPAALKLFCKAIENNDAVFGSRYFRGIRVHNWSFGRLLLSYTSNAFIRRMLKLESTDATTAYKMFKRDVLEKINFETIKLKRNAFLVELVFRTEKMKFKTEEIPFIFRERESGESKMEFKVAIESLATVFKLSIKRLLKKYS